MNRLSTSQLCATALTAVSLAALLACATPLAPGYAVRKESIEVRYVPGTPPHLAVRAECELKNVGNTALRSIRVALPDEKHFGRQNLRVQLNGREIVPAAASDDGGAAGGVGIPFDPAWPQKQNRSLVIQYDLELPSGGKALGAVDSAYFYLPTSGWFPAFQEPKNFFAHDIRRPVPLEFILRVPENFRVHAAGALAAARRYGSETEWRYRIGKLDADPFAVAGTYQEQAVKTPDTEVTFWTFQPVPPDVASAAGTRLAATVTAYMNAFGPLSKRPQRIWIARTQSKIDASLWSSGPAFGTRFPDGLLLNESAFNSGMQSEEFLGAAENGLAHLWMGDRIEIRPEAELVMENGFADYATIVAAEARGGESARRKRTLSLLDSYNRAKSGAVEKPLAAVRWDDPAEQRGIAYSKAPLFFIALEDTYGEAPIRRGIAHLVSALRGNSAGLNDLRAALEQETGKSLAEFFRAWLDGKGIPAEFVSRYQEK